MEAVTAREEAEEETTATSPGPSPDDGRSGRGAAGALVGKFFSAHGRMVLGLCRLLLRDPIEAEDAAQQVFLSAHKALVAGALPRDPPAWLAAIARNECRARIRARVHAPLELPELPADLPDPLAAAIRHADLDAVWVALSELPRRQRRAFLLRELGGLSYGELGAALGVTRPAVESLLFRARQQVRDALATVNAALVPIALRDQLARLIPDFGAGVPAGAVPVAAKVAAVTAGLGLGAAGVVALPSDHGRDASRQPSQAARHKAVRGAEATASLVGSPSVGTPSPIAAEHPVDTRREDRRRGQEHANRVGHDGAEKARGGDSADDHGGQGGGGGAPLSAGERGDEGDSNGTPNAPGPGSSGPGPSPGGGGVSGGGSGSPDEAGGDHGSGSSGSGGSPGGPTASEG